MIRQWWQTRRARLSAERELYEAQARELQAYNSAAQSLNARAEAIEYNIARDLAERAQWRNLAMGGQPHVYSEEQIRTLQANASNEYKHNPWARSPITSFRKYIAGRGFRIKIKDSALTDRWRMWSDDAMYPIRIRESIERLFKVGEVFLQKISVAPGGLPCDFRFIPTYLVGDPQKRPETSYGIQCAPHDVETPVAYYVQDENDRSRLRDGRALDASEVHHIKIGGDSEFKRGITLLEPVMWLIPHLPDLFENRIYMHRMRSALVATLTMSGGQTAIDADAVTHQAQLSNDSKRLKAWKKGTILRLSPGVKAEFVSPNFDAADAGEDIRLFLLGVCAATELAEFMVSADASNANYSSTLVSESPAVRAIQDRQDFLGYHLMRDIRWVLSRLLGISDQAAKSIDVTLEWPPIIQRDLLELTKALSLQRSDGILSRSTYQAQVGLEPEIEDESIDKEAPAADDGAGDNLDDDDDFDVEAV